MLKKIANYPHKKGIIMVRPEAEVRWLVAQCFLRQTGEECVTSYTDVCVGG